MSTPKNSKKPQPRSSTVKLLVRVHPDVAERAKYWAQKQSLSTNQYIALALEEKIGRANGDYDLPALEIQRLNQLIDEHRSLTTSVNNMERVVVNGFDSLLGMTRGDSYLQDEEDGELNAVPLDALGDVTIDSDTELDELGGTW